MSAWPEPVERVAEFLRKVANRLIAATFVYRPFANHEDGVPLLLSYVVHPLPFPVDLIRRRTEAMQQRLCERQRHFAFAGEHTRRASFAQHGKIPKSGGP